MEGLEERLRALSAEFGAEALSQACDALGGSGGAAVLGRLQKLEAKQASLERSIVHETAKAAAAAKEAEEGRRDRERIARLEAEVVRLSGQCFSLEERISSLTRLFEGEQLYRRGCEYLYGTNGYGEQGEYLSEGLSFSVLKESADSGHSDAQFQVGRCLLDGRGCTRDEAECRLYLERSASAGNSYAENYFGACLQCGIGGAKDEALGVEYLRRSADQGNAIGATNLGCAFENGLGVAKDPGGRLNITNGRQLRATRGGGTTSRNA
jgi:TPR repeat protein